MPSEVISSLESQLSGWLGKKGQNKLDVASGCAFGDSAKSIGDRARPGCTADVQLHWLLYQISAEIVGKPYGMASSSGFCGAEECRQLLPACLPAHQLRSVLLPMARALTAHSACRPHCGGAPLAWAGKVGRAEWFMPRQWQGTM